jgi:hypothetical protein
MCLGSGQPGVGKPCFFDSGGLQLQFVSAEIDPSAVDDDAMVV